ISAAVERGVKQERDRVLAHLQLGESSGDMATAVAAIRSGDGLTLELTARYQSAAMNRSDRNKRQGESDATATTVAGSGPATTSSGLLEQTVAILERQGSF